MVRARLIMCGFTVALWVVACGPAAPASESGVSDDESPTQVASIAPGVQMLNGSLGDRESSQDGSVRSQSPTQSPEPMRQPTVALQATQDRPPPPTVATKSASIPAPTPESTVETQELDAESVHAEIYQAVNAVRAEVSEFPMEVHLGLEAAAQIYADGGAWNGGPHVESLLFDQDVRCEKFQAMSTGYPSNDIRKGREEQLVIAELYLPDVRAWSAQHEDYANHLLWWMQWPEWDTLILGHYTHMGYGAAVNPKMSNATRGNHPGVMIVCEK